MNLKNLIKIIAIYSIGFLILLSFVILESEASYNEKSILKMAITFVIIWCVLGGISMYILKDKVRSFIISLPFGWKKKFFFFTLLLILVEEGITTSITNLAPVFGGEIGGAFITASTNYFHVILFHSAIMFIPFIGIWIYLLSKYDFKTSQVFLLFGLFGTLAESMLNPYALISGFWFFVYGLMVYLPVYSIPKREKLQKPGIKAYIIAIIFPFIISIPMSFIVIYLRGFFGIELFV